jgi:hypothetical protein
MTLQAANTPRIVEINHDSLQLFSDSQAECRGFDSLRPLHRSPMSRVAQKMSGPCPARMTGSKTGCGSARKLFSCRGLLSAPLAAATVKKLAPLRPHRATAPNPHSWTPLALMNEVPCALGGGPIQAGSAAAVGLPVTLDGRVFAARPPRPCPNRRQIVREIWASP